MIGEGAVVKSGKVCATPEGRQSICTEEVYIPHEYQIGIDSRYDIAVAVFPEGSFTYHHNLTMTPPKVNDSVLMVGFSALEKPTNSTAKRWGRNQIAGFEFPQDERDGGPIVTKRTETNANYVAVSPGDSGGPIFDTDCRLLGVASRMSIITPKKSLHTKVSDPLLANFWAELKRSVDPTICGLGTTTCQTETTAVASTVPDTNTFPCASIAEAKDSHLAEAKSILTQRIEEQLAEAETHWFHCGNAGVLRQRNRGRCVRASFETRTDEGVSPGCLAQNLFYDGRMISTKRQTYFGGFVEFKELDPAISCNEKDNSFRGCCVKNECFAVTNGQIQGEEIACPEKPIAPRTRTWIAEDPEDLAEKTFRCSDEFELALRETRGRCVKSEYRKFTDGSFTTACTAQWLYPDGRIYEGEIENRTVDFEVPNLACANKEDNFAGCCVLNRCYHVERSALVGEDTCTEVEINTRPYPDRVYWNAGRQDEGESPGPSAPAAGVPN